MHIDAKTIATGVHCLY